MLFRALLLLAILLAIASFASADTQADDTRDARAPQARPQIRGLEAPPEPGFQPAYDVPDRLYERAPASITDQTDLRINEFMADNETTLRDPADGKFDDWFEIYNAGLDDVNLQGLYLTDDPTDPLSAWHHITQTILIPGGGFALLWADGEPEQGPNHVGFGLSRSGEQLALFDANGTTLIDSYTFGIQTADVSQGRFPDGAENWIFFGTPTPGRINLLYPPSISGTVRTPLLPTAADTVTVTAEITDDGTLLATTLYYSVNGGGFATTPLNLQGGDLYAAQIPSQSDGTLVGYYILAEDDDGQTITDPRGAPDDVYAYQVGYQPPTLYINEFMASNRATLEDPDQPGAFPDWIELYNPGPLPVQLGGKYLTDELNDPQKYRITDTLTIPAGGFVVFYADEDPEQGAFHTNFQLNAAGDSIGLFDSDIGANQLLDVHTFGAQMIDISEGRCPDGGVGWFSIVAPTPGATNIPCSSPPTISDVVHTPTLPSASDAVTVTASITDDGALIGVTLLYSVATSFLPVPMTPLGDDSYSATIPPHPDGTWVSYYVLAEDDGGLSAMHPADAPTSTHRYLVGYQPPAIYLNEIMAANDGAVADPDDPGDFPDWIEVYNPGPALLDLGGLYLTDDLSDPSRFRIPDNTFISAGGFILFWADNEPEQGPLHTNFRLSADGEAVGLFGAEGTVQIDAVSFPPQAANFSYGRIPDGTGAWQDLACFSPGKPNDSCHPVFLPTVVKGS